MIYSPRLEEKQVRVSAYTNREERACQKIGSLCCKRQIQVKTSIPSAIRTTYRFASCAGTVSNRMSLSCQMKSVIFTAAEPYASPVLPPVIDMVINVHYGDAFPLIDQVARSLLLRCLLASTGYIAFTVIRLGPYFT